MTGNVPAGRLTGTLAAAQIPDLDAGKITGGVLSADRIPSLDAGKISGGVFGGDGRGLTNLILANLVTADKSVSAWGNDSYGQSSPPAGLLDVIQVSAGFYHSVALQADGTVVVWGADYHGQSSVPAGLTHVVAVDAGVDHTLALKSDGTVVAWGEKGTAKASVPSSLGGVVAISAGKEHNLALRSDGTVVAWGDNTSGQTSVPTWLSGVVAVSAGYFHSVALKGNGTVVAWGRNDQFQCNVPSGLGEVMAIAAGETYTMALKRNGTVVEWGESVGVRPAGLANVVAIDVGRMHSLALKSDGTVAAWGWNPSRQAEVPSGLGGVLALAAGGHHNLLIRRSPATARLARLDQPNAFEAPVTAPSFAGDGSALAALNASALTSGTVPLDRIPFLTANLIPGLDADKITSGMIGEARLPSLSAGKITSGVLSPDRIPTLDAGKISGGTFSGNGSGLISLNASALSSGTVPDARLSANVALLNGRPEFAGGVRMADEDLYLRGGSDGNHGLGWFGVGRTFANAAVDGPVLYGYAGGALGSTQTARKLALRWNKDGDVSLGGDLTITNSLNVNSPTGTRAASFIGPRTGNFESAVVHVENSFTGTTASPALRVFGRGSAEDGALSVSANAGRIARFGNATQWVAVLDNAGNLSATSFVALSDRNAKAGFVPVDVDAVLAKVAALPLTTWHYTNDAAATPHLGPMAQDFRAAFGLGQGDTTIATVDADGVALAAIQGLHRQSAALASENEAIREELSFQRAANLELRDELDELRALVRQLQRQIGAGHR